MDDRNKSKNQLIAELEVLRTEAAILRQENRERQQQEIVTKIALLIRQCLDLDDILATTVTEIRNALQCDRVLIYQFRQTKNVGFIAKEALSNPKWSVIATKIEDSCFEQVWIERYSQGYIKVVDNLDTEPNITECYREFLHNLQVCAKLVVPIIYNRHFWGLLIAHHCTAPRHWSATDIQLMNELGIQLGIAVQQAELVAQLHQESIEQQHTEIILEQLNEQLEHDIAEYTAKLIDTNERLERELRDRTKAQESLKDREAILRSIGDNLSKAFIFQYVLEPSGHNYFSYLSAGVEREIGFTVEQLLEDITLWQNLIPESDFQYLILKTEESLANMSIFDIELRRRSHLDPNEMLWIRLCSTPRRLDNGNTVWDGIQIDITEGKETEIALEEFNRRWRSLLDNVQLIVVELDKQGNVNYINPFFQKITDFTEEEVIGKHWFTNFIPSYLHKAMTWELEEASPQGLYNHYQSSILTKSGQERIIAWNNTFLRDISGEVTGSISIGEDITERYHLERMKSEFVSIVSHELRTPMTSIQAALSLICEKIVDPASPEGEKTIQIAADGVDRLVRLVNDMLDLERLESGKIRLEKRPCDTAALIQIAIGEMQEMAKQADVVLDGMPLPFLIEADCDRIVQVLVNLISNAIKFSPSNGRIAVTVELIDPENPKLHQLQDNNSERQQYFGHLSSFVLFSVRDQGKGIPMTNLERIFERFYQIDASDSRDKGGTGLGLTICRNIVEQHGGKIWAESELGKGSNFYFAIPTQEVNNLE